MPTIDEVRPTEFGGHSSGAAKKSGRLPAWLAVVALFALWAVLLFSSSAPGNDSAEAGFLRDLVAHDEGGLQLIAQVRSSDLDSADRSLLDRVAGVLDEQVEMSRDMLNEWNVDAEQEQTAMAWMGHVVPGETPGQISRFEVASLPDGDPSQAIDPAFALLFGQLRGSVLMGRGVLGITSDNETTAAVRLMIEERNELVAAIEDRFVTAGQLPPTWLAAMTTDPGNLDHGDPVGSLTDVAADAIVWIPLAFGSALAVLLLIRRSGRLHPVVAMAAGSAFLAGIGHLALAGPHGDDSLVAGVFFVAVGIGQIVAASVLVARPTSWMLNVAATLAMALIGVYAFFRIYPPPASVGPSDIDLAGVVIVGLQLVAVAAWAARPVGTHLEDRGADAVLAILRDGAPPRLLVGLLVGFAVIGFVVGETDSRPPSEIDVGFAQDMTAHHGQAVQLAQVVEGRLSTDAVNTFRREVPIFQQYEVGLMQSWLAKWGQVQPADDAVMGWMGMEMPIDEMPGIISRAQFDALRSAEGPELDQMFLALLSTHHVGGVQMAAFAAENVDDPALGELASRIARNQRLEIAEYNQQMDRLEYRTPQGSLTMSELQAIAAVAVEEQ